MTERTHALRHAVPGHASRIGYHTFLFDGVFVAGSEREGSERPRSRWIRLVDESPALADISSALVRGRIALGPARGARVWRLGDDPDAPWVLSAVP